AIIVDESPIKPLLTTISPLRRLRRANSMLNSLLYIEAQEAANMTAQTHGVGGGAVGGGLPTLLSNSSSLPLNSDNDDAADNNHHLLTRDISQPKDSCLSVAMSRAERWRRRQLEEEASLSQFSTQLSNIQSDSPLHDRNDMMMMMMMSNSTPPRLLRRNSNLLANKISFSNTHHPQQHHYATTTTSIQLMHSPKRIKTPRKS
ncbi:unnamed protein product, partial [Schistosoma turkestanicum]